MNMQLRRARQSISSCIADMCNRSLALTQHQALDDFAGERAATELFCWREALR
jgi:hypothetical protein